MWTGIWSLFIALLIWMTPAPPPSPTPNPTPQPTPQPTQIVTPRPYIPTQRPIPPTPRPTAIPITHNHLYGAYGLNANVTLYTDCTGATPLTTTSAAIDTCDTNTTYFVGHNYGVFTPLMSMHVGDPITYWDGNGTPHALHVTAIRDGFPAGGAFPIAMGPYEFQTCTFQEINSPTDRIVDAS